MTRRVHMIMEDIFPVFAVILWTQVVDDPTRRCRCTKNV